MIMQPNTTKKEYEQALKSLGLYEDVIDGVVPKTEDELSGLIRKFETGHVGDDGVGFAFTLNADKSIDVSYDDLPGKHFNNISEAISGIMLKGKPLSKQIGAFRVHAFVMI